MTTTASRPALLGVYRPAEPVFVAGDGAWLIDEAGRRHLDFTSGIAVNALGHGHPAIVEAARRALDTGLLHASNLFRTAPAAELAEWLVDHSFADAVFFSNSGAEANEAALKFARRWAREHGGQEKTRLVALRGGFHGRTMGALAVTDRPDYRAPFEPLAGDVSFADPWRPGSLEAALDPARTAAVIVEPIQGEGGVRPLPPEMMRRIRSLCDDADALLIVDEVQVGLGRTGRLWAHEASGIQPDLMTLAKPLAGGLPMGATLLSDRVAEAIRPGDHGSTFGGGPLVAAVALSVCRTVADPAFLATVRARGARVEERLERLERMGPDAGVAGVRGAGLIWGIDVECPASEVVAAAAERGLLVCSAGAGVVRLLPPLTITADELDEGLDRLEGALGC